jgi:hypothetical protein
MDLYNWTVQVLSEISGYHGGEYEDGCLLGSRITNRFFTRGLLIVLMMEAASTSET